RLRVGGAHGPLGGHGVRHRHDRIGRHDVAVLVWVKAEDAAAQQRLARPGSRRLHDADAHVPVRDGAGEVALLEGGTHLPVLRGRDLAPEHQRLRAPAHPGSEGADAHLAGSGRRQRYLHHGAAPRPQDLELAGAPGFGHREGPRSEAMERSTRTRDRGASARRRPRPARPAGAADPDRPAPSRGRVGADLTLGLVALGAFATGSCLALGLPASHPLAAFALWGGLALLLGRTAPGTLPGSGLGAANRITLGRAVLAVAVAALLAVPPPLSAAA